MVEAQGKRGEMVEAQGKRGEMVEAQGKREVNKGTSIFSSVIDLMGMILGLHMILKIYHITTLKFRIVKN